MDKFAKLHSRLVSGQPLLRAIHPAWHPGSKVLVEYSSPNIAKPFHVGHLRSTMIGQALVNSLRLAGQRVVALNWLGDWGTQFGLLTHCLRTKGYRDSSSVRALSLTDLYKFYVEASASAAADDSFRKAGAQLACQLETGADPELVDMWKEIKRISLTEFNRQYDRMGVRFDSIDFESQYAAVAERLVLDWHRQGLLDRKDGVIGIETKKLDLSESEAVYKSKFVTLLRQDRSSVYLSRDLATIIDRYDRYRFDRILYVVGNEQAGHMRLLKSILNVLGLSEISEKMVHVGFRNVTGMSTRAGTAVFVTELLQKGEMVAEKYLRDRKNPKINDSNRQEIVEAMALGGWLLKDFGHPRMQKYSFHWKYALRQSSYDQEPSIFRLQYAYARICSVIENAMSSGIRPVENLIDDLFSDLASDSEAIACLESLDKLSDSPALILDSLDPHDFVSQLFGAIVDINKFYKTCSVAKAENEHLARARLSLFVIIAKLLEECCHLINVKPLRDI